MAFREITVDETDTGNKTFKKFEAIGDKHAGVFVSKARVDGKFGPKDEYTFKNKEGEFTITPGADLGKRLEKAALVPGDKVIMSYVADKEIGKPSPMKVFKVLVESADAAADF